jgi:hypothetical protein
VPLPKEYHPDGENLLSALQGKAVKRTMPLFWEWRGTNREPDWWPNLAVMDGDLKLLMSADGSRKELYDLSADRPERVNIASQYPEKVERLAALVNRWKATLPTEPPGHCIAPVPTGIRQTEKVNP